MYGELHIFFVERGGPRKTTERGRRRERAEIIHPLGGRVSIPQQFPSARMYRHTVGFHHTLL